jgi:glycosyltransferase involved in cell wall biosynthesis
MHQHSLKIISLTPGAGGMLCGSCLSDNMLAAAMRRFGHDVALVPLYTPITTDEENMSSAPLFYGGLNVYLQQYFSPFRYMPKFLDRFLDYPRLVSSFAKLPASTSGDDLSALTLSMVRGEYGHQRKEVRRLVDWMHHETRPDVIHFSNLLIAGSAREIKRSLSIPIVVTLQGDDIFLDSLPEPQRSQILIEMQKLAEIVDQFIVHSSFYAEKMAGYFNIPKERISQVPLGIDATDFLHSNFNEQDKGEGISSKRIGYLARICPAKGLDLLVDAFIDLKQQAKFTDLQLWVAGDLSKMDRPYLQTQEQKIKTAGHSSDFYNVGRLSRREKIDFLKQLDLFSVPAPYQEPKGRYVLEALASGVPVVQPAHGAFPELLARTGGGQLFSANDSGALAEVLAELLTNHAVRGQLALEGPEGVRATASADHAAHATIDLYHRILDV